MATFLRVIRYKNILILITTQALIYFGLMLPAFERNGITPDMGFSGFFWMSGITSLIAIAGYLINDLMDMAADRINRGNNAIIGRDISFATARWLYLVMVVVGFCLSWYYAYHHKAMSLLFIYPVATAGLAFYSYRLKGIPLLGNIAVAAFSAGVAAIVWLFERKALTLLEERNPLACRTLVILITAFCLFAFISSLFREVIKDMEDEEGDRAAGIRSTAVGLGSPVSRKLAFITGVILFLGILVWTWNDFNSISPWLVWYGNLLALFTAGICYTVRKARHKTDFHQLSQSIKILMGLGIGYLALYIFVL